MKLIFPNKSSLAIHERLIVLLFSCFMFALTKYAMRAPEERWPRAAVRENLIKRQIVIWISGEIDGEGRYHFNEGDDFKIALEGLLLKKEADISGFDLSKPLKTGQRIKIKKMHKPLVNK